MYIDNLKATDFKISILISESTKHTFHIHLYFEKSPIVAPDK